MNTLYYTALNTLYQLSYFARCPRGPLVSVCPPRPCAASCSCAGPQCSSLSASSCAWTAAAPTQQSNFKTYTPSPTHPLATLLTQSTYATMGYY